jgi:hypothetical protein
MAQCDGKGAYFNEVQALCTASERMEDEPGLQLRAYKCRAAGCPFWHLTSKPLHQAPTKV